MLAAARQDGQALQYASAELKADPQFVIAVIREDPELHYYPYQSIDGGNERNAREFNLHFRDIGATLTQMNALKNAVKAEEETPLHKGMLVSKLIQLFALKNAGFKLAALKNAGFTLAQLCDAGFTADHFKDAEITLDQMKVSGCTALQLKNVGFTLTQLKDAGFTADELGGMNEDPNYKSEKAITKEIHEIIISIRHQIPNLKYEAPKAPKV